MERMPDVKHEPLIDGFVEPIEVLEILDGLRIDSIAVGQIERTAGVSVIMTNVTAIMARRVGMNQRMRPVA